MLRACPTPSPNRTALVKPTPSISQASTDHLDQSFLGFGNIGILGPIILCYQELPHALLDI